MGIWEEVQTPPNTNIIGCHWVFKAKKDVSGKIVHYKARLVTQGFSQVLGVDYFDTYVPVARLTIIRVVLVMCARLDMEIRQINIKSTYLNGELDPQEVVYMCHPPGYRKKNESSTVLHLLRPLYGLKQAG